MQALHASLQALAGGIRPLLVQQEGRPLARLKADFLEAARAGERPLMLCVGAAWTGLSLWDETVPDALTDLVIPLARISRHSWRALEIKSVFHLTRSSL